MFRIALQIIAAIAIILAAGLMWQDFTNSDELALKLGQFWHNIAPESLQITEAVVARYIDPCGLIRSLGCSPFLWHPIISGLLVWPAVLVFTILAVVISLLARLLPKLGGGRRSSYRREGR